MRRGEKIYQITIEKETAELRQAANENTTESSATESGPQRKKSKKGLFSLLEDLVDSPSIISDDPKQTAKKEIQQYLTLDTTPTETTTDPVNQFCAATFLSSLVRKYFSIYVSQQPPCPLRECLVSVGTLLPRKGLGEC